MFYFLYKPHRAISIYILNHIIIIIIYKYYYNYLHAHVPTSNKLLLIRNYVIIPIIVYNNILDNN